MGDDEDRPRNPYVIDPSQLRARQHRRWKPLPIGSTHRDLVSAAVHRHLPAELQERYLSLLRQAVGLVETTEERRAVARLGGLPRLPLDVPWPAWEGHGPMAYVGEVHCRRLGALELDLPVPESGRLLFFFYDGDQTGGDRVYDTAYDDGGATVLHVPADVVSPARETPRPMAPFREGLFSGVALVTAPNWEHPDLRAAFPEVGSDDLAWIEHPLNRREVTRALWAPLGEPLYLVGGYAFPVQSPPDDQGRRLLLQIDAEGDLGLRGDDGALYWMTTVEPDRPDRLGDVSFVHQFT